MATNRVQDSINKFPSLFSLRAFPKMTFRLDYQKSYVNDDDLVKLIVQVKKDEQWLDFANCTEFELSQQILDEITEALPEVPKVRAYDPTHAKYMPARHCCSCGSNGRCNLCNFPHEDHTKCKGAEHGEQCSVFIAHEVSHAFVAGRDTEEQLKPVACDIYWEGPTIQCEHCNADIESAYGDPSEVQ